MLQARFFLPGDRVSMRNVPAPTRVITATAVLLLTTFPGFVIALSRTAQPWFIGHGPVRGWAAGPLGTLPIHLTAAQLYLALAAMMIGWAGMVAFGARWLGARPVIAAIVALHVVYMVVPPVLSTDVFSYVDYARLGVVHHLNPYTASPSLAPYDPVFRYVHWRGTSSVYGPLFTVLSYGLASFSPAFALWSLKVLAAAASLGIVALLWRLAQRLDRSPVEAVAIFGLNPALVVWTVGGAHNDLLMLLLVVGGIALVLAGRELAGGAAVALAAGIKASAGLALPFVVLGAQRRWRALAGALAGIAVLVAIAYTAFPDHAVGMIGVLHRESRFVSKDSLPNQVALLVGLHRVNPTVRLIFELIFVAAIAFLLVRAWRRRDWVGTCGWAFLALVSTSTWFLIWYAVWPLPFAALARRRWMLAAVVALQVLFVWHHAVAALG
jgi:alpha-1,6-mannosyltransferase